MQPTPPRPEEIIRKSPLMPVFMAGLGHLSHQCRCIFAKFAILNMFGAALYAGATG